MCSMAPLGFVVCLAGLNDVKARSEVSAQE